MPGFTCCVPLCFNNNKKHRNLKFYNFPKNEKFRKLWILKINRQGLKGKFSLFKPTTGHRVCSAHFVNGKKTYLNNVPTIFPWRKDEKVKRRTLKRREYASQSEDASYKNTTTCRHDHSYAITFSSSSYLTTKLKEKDETIHQLQSLVETLQDQIVELSHNMDKMKENIVELKSKLQEVKATSRIDKSELNRVTKQLSNKTFGIESLKANPEKLKFYTGVTDYSEFSTIYNFFSPDVPDIIYWGSTGNTPPKTINKKKRRNHKLTSENQLFMVLVRLRTALLEEDLAYRFEIHHTTVSRVCRTFYDLMHNRFRQIPIWPSKSLVEKTLPQCFKLDYPTTRVIIDCTELFIQTPSHFRVQSETFSSYKNHNTAKGLIGISPNGFISFVSDLAPGRMSDKEITEKSGLRDLLSEGDSVMADRGFVIDEYLAKKHVQLNIPPFMTGEQLSPSQEEETRRIAKVRIHVERAIERIKNYRILNFVFPNAMI